MIDLVVFLAFVVLINAQASVQITLSLSSALKYHNAHHRFSLAVSSSSLINTVNILLVAMPHS
jgi:hypothetical protein